MASSSTPRLRYQVPLVEKKLEIVSGWKDIANYLGKGVRTVQRYERELGLPVRRPAGKATGSVIATKAELDAWIMASPIRDAFQLPSVAAENAALLSEFRERLKELRRLRQESAELREKLHGVVELLRANLSCSLPQQDQSPESSLMHHVLADVLPFDPIKKKVN
jgi:hypothetical protein